MDLLKEQYVYLSTYFLLMSVSLVYDYYTKILFLLVIASLKGLYLLYSPRTRQYLPCALIFTGNEVIMH